jgi:predicted nuclease of predicted toxin-antitoxin system
VPEPVRFLLDEMVQKAIAEGLRRVGIEARTVNEAGRAHLSDEEHLAWSGTNGWVLVTYDHGFIALAASQADHAGIAYCHSQKHSIGQMIQVLRSLHGRYTCEELAGQVVFL